MCSNESLASIYVRQKYFQERLVESGMYGNMGYIKLPDDNVKLFSYHVQAMVSELGEVLEADKRWKNFRNGKYSREEKLKEIADCFLTMMNIAVFSGYTSWELEEAILSKMEENMRRVEKAKENKRKLEENHKIAEEWED